MIEVWTLGIGEPLVISGENVRLRRLGNLSNYITEDENIRYRYFSISFEHYKKIQLATEDTVFDIKPNYHLHVMHVPGYKKNVSVARILTHKIGAKKIRREMEKINKKPDVLFCGNTPLELVKEASAFSKKYKIPLIIDVRDMWPDIFRDSVPTKYRNLINQYIKQCKKSIRESLNNATSFVGLSDAFLEYECKLANRNRTSLDAVIPIGYPAYDYNFSISRFDELWSDYKIKNSDFIVVFAGNFGRQYQFDAIIEASNILKNYKDIKFVLCGTGEQLEIVRSRCSENVIFPGWIEKDMIVSLLQYSKIGLAPYIDSENYRNNTPNKFGEYLSASLPILISVDGIMNNYLQDNNCGSYYSDGNDLAAKVLAIRNSSNYSDMSKAARTLYEEEFEVNRMNEKLKKHITKIAQRGM